MDKRVEAAARAPEPHESAMHDMLHLAVQMVAIVRAKSPGAADKIQAEVDRVYLGWREKVAAISAADVIGDTESGALRAENARLRAALYDIQGALADVRNRFGAKGILDQMREASLIADDALLAFSAEALK